METDYAMMRTQWFRELRRVYDLCTAGTEKPVLKQEYLKQLSLARKRWELKHNGQLVKPKAFTYDEVYSALERLGTSWLGWEEILNVLILFGKKHCKSPAKLRKITGSHAQLGLGSFARILDGVTGLGKQHGPRVVVQPPSLYPELAECNSYSSVPGTLDYPRSVNILYLSINSSQLSSSSIPFPANLIILNLANNNIRNLEFIQSLTQLRLLNVSNNKIARFTSFCGLPVLSELYIAQNYLTSISKFGSLLTLQIIDASQNKIYRLEDIAGLSPLKLSVLSLSGNTLASRKDYPFPLSSLIHKACIIDPEAPCNYSDFKQFSSIAFTNN